MTASKEGFDYINSTDDILQNELAMAADNLARMRLGIEWPEQVDPRIFFETVSEIAQEFYDSYAPDHSLDGLLPTEIIDYVCFAVANIRRGRTTIS